jgi:hypothetical protein
MTTTADQPIDLERIRKHVARGAAFLDEKRPGWADRIDLDSLSLEDCTMCVLGQEYEDDPAYDSSEFGNPFEAGAWQLFGEAFNFDDNAPVLIEHGFSEKGGNLAAWEALTNEWLRVLRERRAAR